MISFNIKVDADKAIKTVKDMKVRITDWSVLDQVIHLALIEAQVERFETGNQSEGTPWEGYQAEPKFAKYKKAVTGHLDIGRWDPQGVYEEVFPSYRDASDRNHIWISGRQRFVFGSRAPNAFSFTQNKTGPFGEPSPARTLSKLGPESTRKISTLITDWIFKGMRR